MGAKDNKPMLTLLCHVAFRTKPLTDNQVIHEFSLGIAKGLYKAKHAERCILEVDERFMFRPFKLEWPENRSLTVLS